MRNENSLQHHFKLRIGLAYMTPVIITSLSNIGNPLYSRDISGIVDYAMPASTHRPELDAVNAGSSGARAYTKWAAVKRKRLISRRSIFKEALADWLTVIEPRCR